MAIIGIALFLAVLIQLILFIPAYGYKTDKLTDLSYAITFFLLALLLFVFNPYTGGKLVLLIMITLWALRLGSYLFKRILHMGRDARFDGIREDFFRFMGFWLFQGVTIWIIIIPAALYFGLPKAKFNVLTLIGLIIWLVGLIIETIADHEKFTFKINPKNALKWLDTGLWHYSRHPNYFGEVLCWFGIYLFAVSSLSGFNILIALISPVFIAILLLYYSGVPGLEKSADERFGKDRRYREYKKNTSVLLLLPPKNQKITFKKTYRTKTVSAQEFLKSLGKKVKKISNSAAKKTKKIARTIPGKIRKTSKKITKETKKASRKVSKKLAQEIKKDKKKIARQLAKKKKNFSLVKNKKNKKKQKKSSKKQPKKRRSTLPKTKKKTKSNPHVTHSKKDHKIKKQNHKKKNTRNATKPKKKSKVRKETTRKPATRKKRRTKRK